jgi:uncharacterized protein (TIGR02145 family)
MKHLQPLLISFFAFLPWAQAQITDTIAPADTGIMSVTIGEQTWTLRNISVDTFRNGDTIFYAPGNDVWRKADEKCIPAWCYFNNNPTYEGSTGKLYNYWAVSDPRGLAPRGWHIASDSEWAVLVKYVGGERQAGDRLKSSTGWKPALERTTNVSGFTALPGGIRQIPIGSGDGFQCYDLWGYWWTSTASAQDKAWIYWLQADTRNITRFEWRKGVGCSVRCVKDR